MGKSRVLVVGASGFVGRWVARAVNDGRFEPHLAVRSSERLDDIAAAYGIAGEVHRLDASVSGDVTRLVQRVRPDLVFNLVGYGVDPRERDPSLAEALNASFPEELAIALGSSTSTENGGPRLVHVGSALEYGTITGDLAETSSPLPSTLYGRTKLAGTLAVSRVGRRRGFRVTTARLFTVFGPGEHEGRLFPSLVRAMAADGDIPLTAGIQKRDFAYVEDVAFALVRLGETHVEPGTVVNLATGVLISVRDFVEKVAAALSIDYSRLDFGAVSTRPEEMEHDPVRVELLAGLLGWVPPSDPAGGSLRALAFTRSP